MQQRILVMSIKPRWVTDILAGAKTVELRRRPPKISRPVAALIYETSPSCRIRLKCMMGPVRSFTPQRLWEQINDRCCVSAEEYDAYFADCAQAHAIELSQVEELVGDLSLARLRREADFTAPQAWAWASDGLLECVGVSG